MVIWFHNVEPITWMYVVLYLACVALGTLLVCAIVMDNDEPEPKHDNSRFTDPFDQ